MVIHLNRLHSIRFSIRNQCVYKHRGDTAVEGGPSPKHPTMDVLLFNKIIIIMYLAQQP